MTPAPPTVTPSAAALETGRRGITVSAILGGLATASGIALTATAGWLIVAASHRPVILTLLSVIVAVRTFGIARPVLRYLERVRSHDVALDALGRRRVAAYEALVPLTPARLGRRSRSDVLTGAVDDLEDHVFSTVRVTVPVVGNLVAGALTVIVLFLLVPAGALVLLAVLLAHAAVSRLQLRLEVSAQPEWLAARSQVREIATTGTTYADGLRGAEAADWLLTRLDQAHNRLEAATRRMARARIVGTVGGIVVTAAGTVLAALTARWAMTVGLPDAVAAIVVLAPLAVGDAFVGLPDAMTAAGRAAGSRDRLRTLLAQPPAVRAAAQESEPITPPPSAGVALQAGGVCARWHDDGAALDLTPTDLSVAPGEQVVLVGPNGSGKSTLLAVLARHLDPASGSYLLGGADALRLPLERARAHLAVVDDEPHVFASTVRENLRLVRPDATDDELLAALAAAGLRDWLRALPDGLDTMLGTGHRGVSGGERARLAIARGHLSQRPVVLLDEPVAHLDHATAVQVLSDLRSGLAGRTIVMVSHRPDGVDGFDRVIALTRDTEQSDP